MIAYSYDSNHYYNGTVERQLDPLETANTGEPVYLLPANATEIQPPDLTENQRAVWDGAAWIVEEIPLEPEPMPPAPPGPSAEERIAALENALCEQDAANSQRMSEIENALCEMDRAAKGGS